MYDFIKYFLHLHHYSFKNYSLMKKVFYLMLFSVLLSGCVKNEVDIRDSYTGTWSKDVVGTYYEKDANGSITYTLPYTSSENVTITKSADGLIISSLDVWREKNIELSLTGSIIADFSVTENGYISGVATVFNKKTVYEAQPNPLSFTIYSTTTGTWSNTKNGTVSCIETIKLIKK